MTELGKELKYESLGAFLERGIRLNKSVLVVPYYSVKKSGNVFALYTLNQKGVICDFGTRYNGSVSVEKYVSEAILLNSLGTINLNERYIYANSSIAYSLVHSVEMGYTVIDSSCPPIIFVRIEVTEDRDLNSVALKFKQAFKARLQGNLESFNSESFNLVWISPEDSFYMARGTTFNVIDDDGDQVVCDINDGGLPAERAVTNAYLSNRAAGENPFTLNYAAEYNCCPEVDFYKQMSFILSVPLLQYFDGELDILV